MKPLSEYPTPERDDLWASHDGLTPALAAQLLVLSANQEQRLAACRDILACINSSQCLSDEIHAEIRETLDATK